MFPFIRKWKLCSRNVKSAVYHVLFISCIILVAAMQKFNESKQSDETVTEKTAKTPENVELLKKNVRENRDTPEDSRPRPPGESNEDDTATPDAQENSMSCSLVVYKY